MRQAKIIIDKELARILSENDEAYFFEYNNSYLKSNIKKAVSVTLPLQKNLLKLNISFRPLFSTLYKLKYPGKLPIVLPDQLLKFSELQQKLQFFIKSEISPKHLLP